MTTLRRLAFGMLFLSSSLSAQEIHPTLFQGLRWRNIGPFRGGRSVAVTGVASRPYTFYFGGVGSGVWKTTDAGQTWRNIGDSTFGTASVGALAVAGSDPNVVYVGMGEHAVRGVMTSHGDGVYRSTDAGRTWHHLGLDGTRAISRIRVHPENPDLVYVAAQGAPYGPSDDRGIYRSPDGGVTWERILFVGPTAGASDLAMDPTNPRILYAAFWDHLRLGWEVRSGGPGSGIWKSTDGGDSWTRLTEGFPELMGKTSVAVSADPDRLYAMVEADPGGGLFRSDDGGAHWRVVNDTWTIRARAWYYIEVFADPVNADVVWVLNAPVMKSIDGGKTFTRVRTPHGDNHDLWINPTNPDFLINANDGGANVSLNGGRTWSSQRNQPTAQFYRVNVDRQFPYHVYGGQQDNSSVVIASETAGGGIGWKDWYASAGCESAYLAFDPDNPRFQYGGCYMGQIQEYDARTGRRRNIMAYPMLPAALASRDMKYRFNWNAPIVVSRHDPRVIYHAGNVVLRSRDRGVTWDEISPDLTRDQDSTQGPGGGPITNEGAGGEIYNTIMYLAESPLDADILWAGSDDGLVHLTRDGGATWMNVTPDDMAEGIVNAIDASPHNPAVAWVAFTRYKFNDFTPHVYRTTDFGKSWRDLTDGIPATAHVRVVREDPQRAGLLYAGTELGVFVSWDRGEHWQSLQRNLPLTPVTDLIVQDRENDLVASTQGRAFWILDDLTPLQQMDPGLDETTLHLFGPRNAVRMAGGGGFRGGGGAVGQNPPRGAVIDFIVGGDDTLAVNVDILNAEGEVVRRYASPPSDEDGVDSLKIRPGHNRLVWDLRYPRIPNVPGAYVFGSLAGRRVIPGRYEVRITRGGEVVRQTFSVLPDPRIAVTADGFAQQDAFLARLDGELQDMTADLKTLRTVREQIDGLVQRVADRDRTEELRERGTTLSHDLEAIGDSLLQRRTVDGQTVINFPSRLRFQFIYLRGAVDGLEGEVTGGDRAAFADLDRSWIRLRAVINNLLGPELDAFNALVARQGIPAIVSPRKDLVP